MTEESFQQCRKTMQSANHLRGMITAAKGNVAKWGRMEDVHRREMREGQANGAKKCLDRALKKLDDLRLRFAAMKFPDSDIKKEYKAAICKGCSSPVAQGNDYCGECLCENDCEC